MVKGRMKQRHITRKTAVVQQDYSELESSWRYLKATPNKPKFISSTPTTHNNPPKEPLTFATTDTKRTFNITETTLKLPYSTPIRTNVSTSIQSVTTSENGSTLKARINPSLHENLLLFPNYNGNFISPSISKPYSPSLENNSKGKNLQPEVPFKKPLITLKPSKPIQEKWSEKIPVKNSTVKESKVTTLPVKEKRSSVEIRISNVNKLLSNMISRQKERYQENSQLSTKSSLLTSQPPLTHDTARDVNSTPDSYISKVKHAIPTPKKHSSLEKKASFSLSSENHLHPDTSKHTIDPIATEVKEDTVQYSDIETLSEAKMEGELNSMSSSDLEDSNIRNYRNILYQRYRIQGSAHGLESEESTYGVENENTHPITEKNSHDEDKSTQSLAMTNVTIKSKSPDVSLENTNQYRNSTLLDISTNISNTDKISDSESVGKSPQQIVQAEESINRTGTMELQVEEPTILIDSSFNKPSSKEPSELQTSTTCMDNSETFVFLQTLNMTAEGLSKGLGTIRAAYNSSNSLLKYLARRDYEKLLLFLATSRYYDVLLKEREMVVGSSLAKILERLLYREGLISDEYSSHNLHPQQSVTYATNELDGVDEQGHNITSLSSQDASTHVDRRDNLMREIERGLMEERIHSRQMEARLVKQIEILELMRERARLRRHDRNS
ncbi:hypothetical protein K7432_010522 [Basidiobolus ranarum]|uniref:Uncharacterized protein n=1 Tax=Basidiobolus ranarum TaxID=34480 RepID=A0ABR2WNP1_9FUNG